MSKIIVIDDDASLLKTIGMFLVCEGYSVIECNSAIKGYLEFKSQMPDLVITDLNMPMTSGVDYIYKVRELDRITPIIAMSANTELLQSLVSKKMELNLSVILKPFQLPDLKLLVDQLLQHPVTSQLQVAGWETRLSKAKERYQYFKTVNDYDGMVSSLHMIYRVLLSIQLTKQGFDLSDLFGNEGFSLNLPTGKTEDSLGLTPLWRHYQRIKGDYLKTLTESESLSSSQDDLDALYQHVVSLI